MERKGMVKTARIFFASLLVVMLLALSSLSVMGGAGIATFFHAAATAQTTQSSTATTESATPGTGASRASDTQAPPVQAGVIDARTAVRVAGPAVVTVVNQLDTSGGIYNGN